MSFVILHGPPASGKSYFTENSLGTLAGFETSLSTYVLQPDTASCWDAVKMTLQEQPNRNMVCEVTDLGRAPQELIARANYVIRCQGSATSATGANGKYRGVARHRPPEC